MKGSVWLQAVSTDALVNPSHCAVVPVDLYRSNIVCQASHCLLQVQHMWLDGYSQDKLAAACAPCMRKGLALPASVLQVLCPCIMRSRCAHQF